MCEGLGFSWSSPELLVLFTVGGLWVLLVRTGAPDLLLRGNLSLTHQELLDVWRIKYTRRNRFRTSTIWTCEARTALA